MPHGLVATPRNKGPKYVGQNPTSMIAIMKTTMPTALRPMAALIIAASS
jgi:hypothetical protein